MNNSLSRRRCGVLIISGALLGAAAPHALAERLPAAAETPVERPIPPSKSELVDSAFRKLALGKDHVTKDDAQALDNFMPVFEAADTNHDERLSFAEFRKAWTAYTASDRINRG